MSRWHAFVFLNECLKPSDALYMERPDRRQCRVIVDQFANENPHHVTNCLHCQLQKLNACAVHPVLEPGRDGQARYLVVLVVVLNVLLKSVCSVNCLYTVSCKHIDIVCCNSLC